MSILWDIELTARDMSTGIRKERNVCFDFGALLEEACESKLARLSSNVDMVFSTQAICSEGQGQRSADASSPESAQEEYFQAPGEK